MSIGNISRGSALSSSPTGRSRSDPKYPTLEVQYEKGWNGILGSDVNFDKWRFSVWDHVNLKLRGLLHYRFSIGGFLNTRSVYIQDYQHFNGNQTLFASEYLNSFQLAPYYANSTTAAFYATGHLEHHFNGLLTNKIPVFRRWNWNLVGGANAFYVNPNNNYVEAFGGLENIFKLFRVDLVGSWLNGHYSQTGIRYRAGRPDRERAAAGGEKRGTAGPAMTKNFVFLPDGRVAQPGVPKRIKQRLFARDGAADDALVLSLCADCRSEGFSRRTVPGVE